MAAEALDPRRTALVFFDTLKVHTYDPQGKGPLPEARAQVEALVELQRLARAAGLPVFYARADHRPDGRDRARGITDLTPGRGGAPAGSADVIDELAPQPGDYQIFKHRWSAFFQTELELSLRARDIDTILLAGGSTEIGIASTAYVARDLDFHTVLVREAVRSGRGRWISDFFVDEIAGGFNRVRSLEQVTDMLRAGGAAVAANGRLASQLIGPTDPPAGSAPPVADPPLDPRHTGVLFFDVLKSGSYDRETRTLRPIAVPTVTAMQRMAEAARGLGLPIFYAQADHRPDGADWASALNDKDNHRRAERVGRSRIVPTKDQGSWGAEIVDEIAPQPGDYVIKKHRWNAFHGTPLRLSLQTAGVTNVLLAGGSTAAGIASTAYGARDWDFNLLVLRDACRGATPEIDAYFMDYVFPRMGRVRTVDQAIGLLSAGKE